MRYTIQTSRACIFPDGQNDAIMLTNVGPVTIYLDSISGVNEQSYPLRPTASIPWDAQRPLFAIVRTYPDTTDLTPAEKVLPEGILEVTRNSTLADKTLPSRVPLVTKSHTMSAAGADFVLNLGAGYLETGSFKRLTFQYEISANGVTVNADVNKFYTWNLFWYDENFQEIRSDTYRSIWKIDNALPAPNAFSVLTVAPKGQYLVLFLSCEGTDVGTDCNGRQFLLKVIGNETDDFGNYPWPFTGGRYYGVGSYEDGSNVLAVSDFGVATTELIFLNSARRLRINWRNTTSVTTAGVLLVRSIKQGIPLPEYGALELPTSASGYRTSLDVDIPESDGIFLDLNNLVLSGAGRALLTALTFTD